MLKIIREQFVQAIEQIDAGNSRISEEQQSELFDIMSRMLNPQEKMSKYQAIQYLDKHGIKICKSTFDNYVREGKLPKSRHQAGFTENF